MMLFTIKSASMSECIHMSCFIVFVHQAMPLMASMYIYAYMGMLIMERCNEDHHPDENQLVMEEQKQVET